MNKKGIFFTVLVIVILSLFLISYTFISQAEQRKLIQKRIETMNNFLFSVEEDLSRQLFISGFRIIFLFEQRILEKEDYIDDVNASFQEAFFNGTIEGSTNPNITLLMHGATFPNITDAINERANKINVNITLSNPIAEITQEDPWNVKVTLTTDLIMFDLAGLASWNRTQVVVAFIPIEGFEDPIYSINTGGTIPNVIKKYPYQIFISEKLIAHAQNTSYISNTDAPSFLDRLEGNLTASNPNGIESLAVPKLTSISRRSIVDHEYFIGTSATQIPTCFPPLPPYFLIDDNHINLYRCIL